MRRIIAIIFAAFLAPVVLFAAREGTPSYYNNNYNRSQYPVAASNSGQNVYVGNRAKQQIVGQQTYSYQVPRQADTNYSSAMTPNGVSIPSSINKDAFILSAEYVREFADFQFETGVQSILEWDDMIVNKIVLRAEKDFTIRGYDTFGFGEFSYGVMSDGGLSMDYDLKPYDNSDPTNGIFTVSLGDQSGTMQNFKIGIGARNIWTVSGWKISPMVGYQVFQHDLKMSNHIYPNPAVYIPLMTQYGEYIYGDTSGNYYSVPVGTEVPDDYYQVCLSPEDLALAESDPTTHAPILIDTDEDGYADSLQTTTYDPLYEYLPWGVGPGECVVVGGDGTVVVEGTTHIYNTTWSGIFLGMEIEKQVTYSDKLRFYGQISLPHYKSEGTWPNRTDWQQNPSFIDEGDTDALNYQLEMEYIYQFNDRFQLSLKVDTTYFYVGKIGGELYVAGYQYYATDTDGNIIYDDTNGNGTVGDTGDSPRLITVDPYTERVTDSLVDATWQSFGLHIGVKYAF